MEKDFQEGSLTTLVSPNADTMIKFQHLRDMLIEFLASSPNIERYLETVLQIKNGANYNETYPAN